MPNIEVKPTADALSDAPQILTTEEVASLLRVDAATVMRWTKKHQLISIVVGPKLHRFLKDALEKHLRYAAFSNTNN